MAPTRRLPETAARREPVFALPQADEALRADATVKVVKVSRFWRMPEH
jgi:hypothetical protein